MSDCSKHKKEVCGISDMKVLAEAIGDLHYLSLTQLLYELSNKFHSDAERDNEAGREKLASALQYTGMGLLEAALRVEKVWKICQPFMEPKP